MPSLLPIIVLLPFLGAALLGLSARRWVGYGALALTTVGVLLSGWVVLAQATPAVWTFDWAAIGRFGFSITLRADALTGLMLLLVHGIAWLVQLYSLSYLHDEPHLKRYFAFLQLFIGAMLGIVMADNLLVLYLFWELVGLTSYLLIGFYTQRPAAGKAAQKAFLMNRIGDIGFLIGIFMTYRHLGTLDFDAFTTPVSTAIGLCLFMGCVAKSAQFPLFTWLPDAMEGPTPVSALLHAATMVAAGIFLLARIHPLLSADALLVITLVGTITTLWGGYSALFQYDIKKVLAFSTVSQLGLMVAGMGMSQVSGAMFHLLTHAFFKAGLFLSAGIVIHATHTQDMRQMGRLRQRLPYTFWAYTGCAAALVGIPLFSGFLSKEMLLAGAFGWAAQQRTGIALLIPTALLAASGLTALYMARQWRLVFFGDSSRLWRPRPHEAGWAMRLPVIALAVLSVFIWFSGHPFSVHNSWFFRFFPASLPDAPVWLAAVSVALVGVGGWLGFRMKEPSHRRLYVQASVQYGFLDRFYQKWLVHPLLRLAAKLNYADQRWVDGAVNTAGIGSVVLAHLTATFDKFGIDGLVNGIAGVVRWLGQRTRQLQSGRLQSYLTLTVVSLLLLLWWILV